MSDNTGIGWTDATWVTVTGCTRVSAGCDHCYAVRQSYRLERMGQVEKYGGLTVLNNRGDRHFNGVVKCHADALVIPLGWRKPRMIFVNSMSDLFHERVPFEFIDRTSLIGPPERVRDRLSAFAEAGVTTLTIATYHGDLDEQIATLRTMVDVLEASGLAS